MYNSTEPGEDCRRTQIEGLILRFPKLLLTKPSKGNFKRHPAKRVEMFYHGSCEGLLQPEQSTTANLPRESSSGEDRHIVDMCIAMARSGSIADAARRLTSEGTAPVTEELLSQIR